MNKQLNPQEASIFATTTTKIPIKFCYLAFEHFCNICFVVGDFGKLKHAWEFENPLPLPSPTFEEKFQELLELHKTLPKLKDKIKTVLAEKPLKFPQYGSKVDPDVLELEREEKKEFDLCELLKNAIGIELYSPILGNCKLTRIDKNSVYPISCTCNLDNGNLGFSCFAKNGKYRDIKDAECVLFPSKEQRDWSKFNPCQFADGELVWVRNHRLELWKCLYHTGKQADDGSHICYPAQTKELGNPIETFINCVKFDQRPF